MKKIVWTPKILDPVANKDPQRWCKVGEHIFKSYTVAPPTKICIYCDKVEDNDIWLSNHS